MAQHFKSKNVDVYAIRYSINCYGGEIDKTACTYGGVTPHEGNKLKNEKNTNQFVDKWCTKSFFR